MGRFRLALHVFRGRPLAYRLTVHGGLEIHEDTRIVGCVIRGLPTDPETGMLAQRPPPAAVLLKTTAITSLSITDVLFKSESPGG